MTITVYSYTIYHSPNAYLLLRCALANLAGVQLVRRPIYIPRERGVMVAELLGGKENRNVGSYLREDCRRWAERFSIPFVYPDPEIFHRRAARWAALVYDREELPARAFYSVDAGKRGPLDQALFEAVWVQGLDVNEPETIRWAAERAGLDADDLVARLAEPGPGGEVRNALNEFEPLRCPGVPTVVVNGQRYFGKDRVDWAIDACRAGTGPLDASAIEATKLLGAKGEDAMADVRVVATGLRFPEGPVAMADGSVILGEIAGGTVTRVASDGTKSTVTVAGGGPNGLARGPDGALYLCNNGGAEYASGSFLATGPAKNYQCGYVQRIDPRTGEMRVLYSQCGGHKLSAPNDIVFDRQGGFYFTDLGKRRGRDRDHGGLYYALPDGSKIVELVHPMLSPNGVGLSPDERTVYVADTESSRLFAFDIVEPGVLRQEPFPAPYTGRLVCGLPGFQRFDSLAVEASGNIAVATLITGQITVISPDGRVVRQVKMPDVYPTNICFGGRDMKTAYVTLSANGQLAAMDWPEPGLSLNFQE